MKNAKIVLVAEWDGWCGACAADRPLVLTRTGRQRLRTWLTAAADDSRPLVLTCRLCGTGVDVPLEQDDPPVTVTPQAREWPATQVESDGPATSEVEEVPVDSTEPLAGGVQAPASTAELTAGREVVAQALGALLAQRTAAVAQPVAPHVPTLAPAVAPVVPLQRTSSSGGLAELQLLADGIDLLSSGRS